MKTIFLITTMLMFAGCSNDTIDTKFLAEECPAPIVCEVIDPLPCEQTIYGHLTDEWMERIDTSSVRLNHYIDEVQVEENLADVVDMNGQLATSNPITIPEYIGQDMKHILIVEFWQVR